MSLSNVLKNITTFGAYSNLKKSSAKKKRRYDREKEKVEEAQKLGLRQQQRSYDIFKDLSRGEYAPETSLKQIRKDEERALRYAGDILEPQKQGLMDLATQQYKRTSRPGIMQNIGGGDTAGSSALNQALAAAQADLAFQVGNQFNQMQFGLADQLLGRRDQGRQEERAQMMNLAGFSNPIAQQVAGTQVPAGPQSWLQKVLPFAGAAVGGYFGGVPGAQAGYQIGQGASNF
jgi:hypothetical protein